MAYSHNARVHHKHRKARRVGTAALVVVFGLATGVGVIGLDWFRNQRSESNTVVSTENTTAVQSVNVSVYRSEYFQFQASEEWRSVASESSEDKFVYVKNDDFLITQRLVVYVNRPDSLRNADMKITNVAPVVVRGNRITPIAPKYVSEHCAESWPEGTLRDPARITHDNVSFVCAPDANQYNIAIGEDGGSDAIPFIMSDGREINITMVYSDLTAYPGSGDLFQLLKGFEVL